jgi:cation diffusion facilitator CzcD-associated flavoprotein CzcO
MGPPRKTAESRNSSGDVQAAGAPRVCVIGAGIAGLVTAKVLLEDGFAVGVFEKEATLGGVWAASRTYPGLHANNSRESYAFSDHPFPSTADDFPSAPQIRAYLESYAERYGIASRIRFGTEVVGVARAEDGVRWEVTVRACGRSEGLEFDFVVVCNGIFSEPNIPQVSGIEQFAGRILHSSQVTDPDLVTGRRVIVVGAGKSALDCAAWAAREGRSCTLVFRRAHWMVPRYLLGVVRGDWLILTRFSQSLLRYHRPSPLEAILHGPGRPVVRLWWRMLCRLLQRIEGIPPSLVPEQELPVGVEFVGVEHETYELVRVGRIEPRRGALRRFTGPTTVELDTGERLEADLVVFATGWRQRIAFLEDDLRQRIERDGGFRLYRHILPPDLPGLGFVGYNSSTACQLTAEVGAHWLAQAFRGELALPSVAEMDREIDRFQRWATEVMPSRAGGFFVGPYLAHYLDELMDDMGLPALRTRVFLVEQLTPLWPTRYRALGEERRRARSGLVGGRRFYVSGRGAVAALVGAALVRRAVGSTQR